MRTLFEIIECAKGEGIDHCTKEELYWALRALDGLSTMTRSDFRKVVHRPSKIVTPEHILEENFQLVKRTINTDPQKWIGADNVPGNPEYDAHRKMSFNILRMAERRLKEKEEQGDSAQTP